MKVELKKETRVTGAVLFCIYIDDRYTDCFSQEEQAREFFDKIGKTEDQIEVLETKEV